jgi:hypothetical protein
MSTAFHVDARFFFFERLDQGGGVSAVKPGAATDAN